MSEITTGIIICVILIGMLSFYVFLIMIIWNNVIVKKFPTQHIENLSFWDALALAVFFSLLSGGSVINTTNNYFK